MLDVGRLEEALKLLGALLSDRGHHFAVVAIGGGGLQLIGVIDRPMSCTTSESRSSLA